MNVYKYVAGQFINYVLNNFRIKISIKKTRMQQH